MFLLVVRTGLWVAAWSFAESHLTLEKRIKKGKQILWVSKDTDVRGIQDNRGISS